jgi:hypothetical protein
MGTITQREDAENGLNEWREMDLMCLIKALRKEYGFSGVSYLASAARSLRYDLLAWAEAELAKMKN